jgi:tetratricopeptide (TPR) repeat protein
LAEYEMALKVSPDDTTLLNWCAATLNNLHRYEDALKVIDRAIAREPNGVAHHYYVRGFALVRLKRLDEALAAAERSRELDPNGLGTWLLKADIHGRRKEYVQKRECLERAVAVTPGDWIIWANFATFLAECGNGKVRDLSRAVEMARKAVTLAPEAAGSQCALGVTLLRAGDLKGSMDALCRATRLESARERRSSQRSIHRPYKLTKG